MSILSDSVKELRSVRSLAGAALFAAIKIVLDMITIPVSPMLEIGFAFLAAALCGYMYGPVLAGISGVAADLLGYFVSPNGAFFPGFTLSAFCIGIIYGLFFYKKKITLKRVIIACLTVVVLINFGLTPLWLYIMYGKSFTALLGLRIVKNIIKFPIDITLLHFALKGIQSRQKQRGDFMHRP